MSSRAAHGVRRLLFAVAWLAAGCVAKVPKVGEMPRTLPDGAAESAYQEVLGRYTARNEIYQLFDTRLFAAATYQSAAFREARVRREAAFKAIPTDAIAAQLEQERGELASFHEFFLGVHVNDPRYDDFDRKNSIWRIALVTPKGEIAPVEVERVGRANLDMRSIYPYMGDFWVAYRVRFPRDAAPEPGERLVLKLASSLGTTELVVPHP